MKRTTQIVAAGFALLLAACQTQGPRGNASTGERLFTQLNCITCHSVKGVGGKSAPAFGAVAFTPNAMAAAMWSHVTIMWKAMDQAGIQHPRLTEQQAADLYAYFAGGDYPDKAGDAAKGRQVYETKLCISCHEPGYASAPSLNALAGHASAFAMVAALWQHGAGMLSGMTAKNIEWQQLSTDDMTNLIAWLNAKK
jgi:mono/diheme cytochrome c family protein